MSAFKSEAQRKKFDTLVKEGKLSNETRAKWEKETGSKRLPERVKEEPKAPKMNTIKSIKPIKPLG